MPKKQKVEFDDLYNQARIIQESVENYRKKLLETFLYLDQIRLNLNSHYLLPVIMEDANKLKNTIQHLDEESLRKNDLWLGYIEPRLSQLEEEMYAIKNLSDRIDRRRGELQDLLLGYEDLVHLTQDFRFQIPI